MVEALNTIVRTQCLCNLHNIQISKQYVKEYNRIYILSRVFAFGKIFIITYLDYRFSSLKNKIKNNKF